MSNRFRVAALMGTLALGAGTELLACGDKFLVAGRGTRYQRPKDARAANVLIYADPASGLPETLKNVSVDKLLRREGHQATRVETLDQLAAILATGRFDVVLAANTVAAAVERLISGAADAPVVVAFCVKPGTTVAQAAPETPCSVKAPPKERTFLEAIDKAVLKHDRARKAQARG